MAMRTLVVEGVTWRVWDTYPSSAGQSRMANTGMAGGWLTFESPTEKRRIVPAPDGWDEWPDERLSMLLRAADGVRQRPADPPVEL
jgi:hypothetical protein